MFLTGLVFASTLVYLVCLEEDLLPAFGNAGVALGTGFLFGLITMMVYYVGLFVMGLHTGLLIGIIVMAIVEQQLMVTNMWISVGVLLGCALLAAVLTLSYQKALTIVGTSLYGGAVLAASMDYYIENWRMVHWLWDRVKLKTSPQPCWFSWLLLAVWPLMVVAGTAVQTFITGRDFYHKYQGESPQPPSISPVCRRLFRRRANVSQAVSSDSGKPYWIKQKTTTSRELSAKTYFNPVELREVISPTRL